MKKITIIDYRTGNVGSIFNMIEYLGFDVTISNKASEILKSNYLILPGVGSFDAGMKKLRHENLVEVLDEAVIEKKIPILGICLGMQLMCRSSEEGNAEGLNWINTSVKKFDSSQNIKIPHMGWNFVEPNSKSKLVKGFTSNPKFYFVHSFYVDNPDDNDIVISTSSYGNQFASVFEKDNIYATQFHPEKSHKYGMTVFKNFLNI